MKLVILSALLFATAFLLPFLSPLVFIFLIPLFYQTKRQAFRFAHGFVWGSIVYSLHLYWFLVLILTRGHGAIRITLWVFTVIYFSLISGIWFWLANVLKKYWESNFAWIISTILYFAWVITSSLFMCGVIEGYTFLNPFVPLAYYPKLLFCLRYVGLWGALFLLFLFQMFLAIYLKYCRYRHLYMSVLCMVPFLMGLLFYKDLQIQNSNICVLPAWWLQDSRGREPNFVGYRMVKDIAITVNNDCNVRAIVYPESTFGWNVYEYKKFILMMCECAESIDIIFGGQRKVDSELRNCCFIVNNGKIVFEYDKQHLMPFVERVSCYFGYFSEMFTSKEDVFGYGNLEQDDVLCIGDKSYQLFICSELFLNAKAVKGLPILFLYNDIWFCCDYAKKLARLYVAYFSIYHDVSIIMT